MKLKSTGRHNTLSDERQQLLARAGFVWDSHQATWEERMASLKQYVAQHGHCNVPAKHSDKTLAIWGK